MGECARGVRALLGADARLLFVRVELAQPLRDASHEEDGDGESEQPAGREQTDGAQERPPLVAAGLVDERGDRRLELLRVTTEAIEDLLAAEDVGAGPALPEDTVRDERDLAVEVPVQVLNVRAQRRELVV